MTRFSRRAAIGVTIAGAIVALAGCATSPSTDTTIYLVRHAEKMTGPNPALTTEGQARAVRLAEKLSDAGVTHIWSTDYRRTQDTAAPLAKMTGIAVQSYNPSDLDGFADQLHETPGVHLVVGHSNTTPALANALGAVGGEPIVEASEYGRFYTITMRGEKIETEITRY